MHNDNFLNKKLDERKWQNAFRQLRLPEGKTDFCSNDYLGIVKNNLLNPFLEDVQLPTGSTGSRLLSGNYPLIGQVEKEIAAFHHAEAALIFNSGYDANVGLLSSVPQRGDTIVYDQLSHASIRDGIRLSFARSFSFAHNNVQDLEKKLQGASGNIFVVTETVFSMDGDLCPLAEIVSLCERYNAHLILDEAHATGVIGAKGEGLVQQLRLHNNIFCRVHTFGKALGCHGAAIFGSQKLGEYLINFARPLIYSTALSPHAIAAIRASYTVFPQMDKERRRLQTLIALFQSCKIACKKLPSETPIQVVVVPGNDEVKGLAAKLQQNNFDVRPILYPSVPKGAERLRVVLHAFNTEEDVQLLIKQLK